MKIRKDLLSNHLKSEHDRYREQAVTAQKEGRNEKAALYYSECVNTLRKLVDLETNNKIIQKWKRLICIYNDTARKLSSETPNSNSKEMNRFFQGIPNIDFCDIRGMTDVKETLRNRIIDPIERQSVYKQYNQKSVNRVLLYGLPGTGKTYISKSLSGELGYNLIQALPRDLWGTTNKSTINNIKNFFELARNYQPCILLIENIESYFFEQNNKKDTTMVQDKILTEIDKFVSDTSDGNSVFIGETHNLETVNKVIYKNSDMIIKIPTPNPTTRVAQLRMHLRDRPVLVESIDWEEIKELTEGYSLNNIEMVATTAARSALKQARSEQCSLLITQDHLENSIAKIESIVEERSS